MAEMNFKGYQTFRGVDYSASPAAISEDHASDMLNMYVGEDGIMQKRPGWRVLKDFSAPINGIHYMQYPNGYLNLFIHAGANLYVVDFRPAWRNFQFPDIGDVRMCDIDTTEHPEFKITASSAAYILRYVSGLTSALPWQVKNMDVNFDGVVDARDASTVSQYVVGLSQTLPTGEYGMLPNSYTLITYSDNSAFTLMNTRSLMFDHEDKLYIIDGKNYYCISPVYGDTRTDDYGNAYKEIQKFTASVVDGYIPNTGVAGYYKYDDLNEEGTNIPGSASNPGVWQKPQLNEARNMLQHHEINTFIADGIHHAYYLRENGNTVDTSDGYCKVELLLFTRCKAVNGVDVPTQENIDHVDAGTYDGIYYYYKDIWTTIPANHATYGWSIRNADSTTVQQNEISYSTRIYFNTVVPAHKENIENIRVTFISNKHASDWAVNTDRGYIRKCTIVAKYGYFNDNRFFLAGNPEHKNWDWASAVDDPTYFPNDGWTKIGSDATAIMGYLHYGDSLAIIKEDNERDATVYMRTASLTDDGDIIFPVQQGQQGFGAISKYAICSLRDDPMFLAKEGVFAIEGTDASQERNVQNRSFYIDSRLQQEATNDSVACEWGNYMLLCIPSSGKCYVADARSLDSKDGSYIYNWYAWDNIHATIMRVIGDRLYFGTHDGKLCVFNTEWDGMDKYSDGSVYDSSSSSAIPYINGEKIHAFYTTKRDHLGAIDYKKTMLNDGGVILLVPYEQSSAQITVKTEKGEWFVDDIQTDSDEPSVVIPIKKRMKYFDSIQTTIENDRLNEGLAILGIQYRYVLSTNRREA